MVTIAWLRRRGYLSAAPADQDSGIDLSAWSALGDRCLFTMADQLFRGVTTMTFTYLFRSLRRHAGRRPHGSSLGQNHPNHSWSHRPTFVPRIEALEERTVLSTLTVTSAADDGSSGTLRAMLATAIPGDNIQFAPQLYGRTITLKQGQLLVN